jgi:hypothetical protein
VPASGDFYGTRLTSRAGRYREVHHSWAGRDYGASQQGYQNNAALAVLTLSGDNFSLFVFDTIDGNNALYVDTLQLVGYAVNVEEAMQINPGMKIYFDNSNVPVDELDGLFDGRLIHLPQTGTSSLVTVTTSSGQKIDVSEGLLGSTTIDSDGDGIPNALDENPFDGVSIQVEILSGENPAAAVSWVAAPRTEYQVQYRTTLGEDGWQTLENVPSANTLKRLTVKDPMGAVEKRFYRVIYLP